MELLQSERLRPRRPNRRKSHSGPSDEATRLLRRTIGSKPLMVPRVDWPDVLAGAKTEFRHYGRLRFIGETPRPAIIYSIAPATGEVESRLAILEWAWEEPMGALSPESLANEGFDDLGEFRRYIDQRYPKGGFRPLAFTRCYRIRIATAEDRDEMAEWALRSLFGDLVP